MKYILAILCFIVAIMCYIKPEVITDNVNRIFGCIFILLGNLFLSNGGKE
jgi:hypothetical protein